MVSTIMAFIDFVAKRKVVAFHNGIFPRGRRNVDGHHWGNFVHFRNFYILLCFRLFDTNFFSVTKIYRDQDSDSTSIR